MFSSVQSLICICSNYPLANYLPSVFLVDKIMDLGKSLLFLKKITSFVLYSFKITSNVQR